MKNQNYLRTLNNSRHNSKFNMIYESIMKDLEIYKGVQPSKLITDRKLNLILEEIEKPQYIVCESSGRSILLEEAIFMDESYLISEGILEKVGQKIQKIIDWIKEGIQKVLSAASDMIKAFCEKVKNNAVVKAIRNKLGLDEKLKSENFKKFVKVSAKGKEVAVESVKIIGDKFIISEATKLTKKEEAITNPKQLDPIIKKYENALSGKAPLKNSKTGQPLSSKYLKERLRLLKNKKASLEQGGRKPAEKANSKGSENKPAEGSKGEGKPAEGSKGAKGADKGKQKPIGELHFDVEGIKDQVITVKNDSISEEAVNSAAKSSATEIGGDQAAKVISGDSPAPKEGGEEAPKKKGLFGKLNDKINAAGNKLKEKIKSGISSAKKWFNSQNKFVKILICAIIAVLAILALYFLITAVIYPILYGIMHGGIVNAVAGVFRIYASGKTFVATYKQGKKSWESGEGWGKTFLMLGMSIMAIVNLGQMAAAGNAQMAADAAKNAAGEAGKSAAEGATENTISKGKNPFDLNGDGELESKELMKMMKENKVPGIDLSSKRYAGINGWRNFKADLYRNPKFTKLFSNDGEDMNDFFEEFELRLQGNVAQSMGGSASFAGNSWWQRFIGADPSAAENTAKRIAKSMRKLIFIK